MDITMWILDALFKIVVVLGCMALLVVPPALSMHKHPEEWKLFRRNDERHRRP